MDRDAYGVQPDDSGQYWQEQPQQDPYAGYYQQPYGYEYPDQQQPQQYYDPYAAAQETVYQQPGAYAGYPAEQQAQPQQYYDPGQYWAPDQQSAYQPEPEQQTQTWYDPYAAAEQQPYPVEQFPLQPEAPAAEQIPAEQLPVEQPPADDQAPAVPAPTPPEPDAPSAGLGRRLVEAATGRAPGTDRRSFLLRAGIGAGALVVLAGAGFLVAGNGADKTGTNTTAGRHTTDVGSSHTRTWAAPADAVGSGGNDGLLGAWLLADAVVRGDGSGVTAYSLTDGHQLWSLTAPKSGAVPCAMSATANASGVGAVLYQAKPGTGQACTQLVAVDTASGKAKWTATINGATKNYGGAVMVNDTRVVAVGDSAAVGYDVGSGKQNWSYKGPGKYCALSGNGTGTTVLLQSTCADTSPKQQAVTLDAGSGKLHWWRGLPQNAASYTVLSAVPAVVAVHMSSAAKDTLMSFTDKGDVQSTIPVSQTGGVLDSTHGSFDPAPALFFQGTTLVAAVEPPTSTAGTTAATAFVGLNLTNGQQLWRTTAQEKGQSVPVAVDDTAMVVATEERLGQPARLSRFDLATGKETVGGQFPQNTGSLLGSGRLLLRDRTVVALPEYTTSYHTAATLWTGQ